VKLFCIISTSGPVVVTVPVVAVAVSVFGVGVVQAINDADTRKHNNSFFIFIFLQFINYDIFLILKHTI
jgi:hypothetical protein